MKIEEFRQMFAAAPEKYPAGLEKGFRRVLELILVKWDHPREMEKFLQELVVDKRGDRQGFPQEILKEILFISTLYEKWLTGRRRKAPAHVLAAVAPGLVDGLEKAQKKLDDALARDLQNLKIKLTRDDPALLEGLEPLLNQKDRDGMTLLMHAASRGAEKCMLHLLKMGANPHMADPAGNTALHWAVTNNRLRAAEILLYFGADPSRRNQGGVPPLFLAVIKQDSTIAGRLVDYGAEINVLDGKGEFPLHKAVMSGSIEGVRFLLAAGAQEQRNREGKNPLDLNTSKNADAIIKVFNEHQAELMRAANPGERSR